MKKLSICAIILLSTLSCTLTKKDNQQKLNLEHLKQNKNFVKNHELPKTMDQNLLKKGINNYVVGVSQGNLLSDNEFVFKDDINIKSGFYTFSTIKKSNETLYDTNDQKTIVLKGNVKIHNKAMLHLRVNTELNASDMVVFEHLQGNGIVYVNAHITGTGARYSNIALLEVPLNCNYNFKLFNKVIVNNVEYVLETIKTKDSKLIVLKPIFSDSDVANEYRYKEQHTTNKSLQVKNNKYKAVYMREKITLFVDKDMIGSSNIIDIVTR